MKKVLILMAFICGGYSFAGPGHGHGHSHGGDHGHSHGTQKISEKKAQSVAKSHILRLIKKGKIDKSWEQASFDKAAKKPFGSRMEWIVTHSNSKGVKGKKLYVFLSETGGFIAANFTGK